MPNPATAVLLGTVLEELGAEEPIFDACTRTIVASRLLEAMEQGSCSLDDLRAIGKEALHKPPTMWR